MLAGRGAATESAPGVFVVCLIFCVLPVPLSVYSWELERVGRTDPSHWLDFESEPHLDGVVMVANWQGGKSFGPESLPVAPGGTGPDSGSDLGPDSDLGQRDSELDWRQVPPVYVTVPYGPLAGRSGLARTFPSQVAALPVMAASSPPVNQAGVTSSYFQLPQAGGIYVDRSNAGSSVRLPPRLGPGSGPGLRALAIQV